MKQRNEMLEWVVVILTAALVAVGGIKAEQKYHATPSEIISSKIEFNFPISQPETLKVPVTPNISTAVPTFQQYPGIVTQVNKWHQEAPDLTEIGIYGKSSKGIDLTYIRVTNKFITAPKPVVLIHGCIHGNEPHATACVMAYIGTMLSTYGKDQEVTTLINTRDIYFVPVMCVDSYPNSRHIDEVDPNRNYPGPSRPNHKSTPCVAQMQNLFTKIKPKAVISVHTYGRVLLHPYGDNYKECPNHADFTRVIGKMAEMCQYKIDRACNMYDQPIVGSEVDWYYRNGAFPIVMEVGTHQHAPSLQEIQNESQRTFKGILYFIQETPLVAIQPVLFEKHQLLMKEKMKIPFIRLFSVLE